MAILIEGQHATDPSYRALLEATAGPAVKARAFVEGLYARFAPYAEDQFELEIGRQFQPRFWEMYLGAALLDLGLELRPSGAWPDLVFSGDSGPVYLEATAPTDGAPENPNSVPKLHFAQLGEKLEFRPVPDDEVLLRLTAAIGKKHRDYLRHMAGGRMSPDAAFVIAVNSAKIEASRLDGDPPRIFRSVLGVRGWGIRVFKDGSSKTELMLQRGVNKKSGAEVPMTLFLADASAGISAVLYSEVDAWNPPDRLGDDFILVHNPMANRPLPHGFIPRGIEYTWTDEGDGYRFRKTVWNGSGPNGLLQPPPAPEE